MADQCCATCRYIFKQPNGSIICRRNPPMAALIMDGMRGATTVEFWPPVSVEEWCGEFRPVNGAVITPFRNPHEGETDASA